MQAPPDPLTIAYTETFETAHGLRVLRDLLEASGFLAVMPYNAPGNELTDLNGSRRLFARVYEILSRSPSGRQALAAAFRPAETEKDNT